MCGIVGYTGARPAGQVLLDSLKRLEYRGYDSCGIAVLNGGLSVYKARGRVQELEKTLPMIEGNCGIGHTRWATHGKPSAENAHPHCDCSGRIAVVHNGIISNFLELREKLTREGHIFKSETDSEAIAHLIESYYSGDLLQAVEAALPGLRGSYALAVIAEGCDYIVVARRDCPLIIGVGEGERFVASDAPAILEYTNRVIFLEDGDVGSVTADDIKLKNNGVEVKGREEQTIPWSVEQSRRGGYDHFMLKEIHEQPRVIRDTLEGCVSLLESRVEIEAVHNNSFSGSLILACGTSYYAGLIGRHAIEKLAGEPVRVEVASEFNHSGGLLSGARVIAITQSGETADTLRAMKLVKSRGADLLAITNVLGSSATRIAGRTIYTRAGPEICVAATKSFIAQLTVLYVLAIARAGLDLTKKNQLIDELRRLPEKVQGILYREDEFASFGKYLAGFENAYLVARGINFPAALEGALKLKEIAYIHAEGYAAGELKHGPFALLTPGTPVIAIVAGDNTRETMLTNIQEIKAREAPVLALAAEGDGEVVKYVDRVVYVPAADPLFSPLLNSVALQLVAYYAAKERGLPIDMPRNLAKSVTVE
jgi:glucosamine--fructose-6-phosphate aminotransferase (isomerizing)